MASATANYAPGHERTMFRQAAVSTNRYAANVQRRGVATAMAMSYESSFLARLEAGSFLERLYTRPQKEKAGVAAPTFQCGQKGGEEMVLHLAVPFGYRVRIRTREDGSLEIIVEPII